jgi:hypothetical protein
MTGNRHWWSISLPKEVVALSISVLAPRISASRISSKLPGSAIFLRRTRFVLPVTIRVERDCLTSICVPRNAVLKFASKHRPDLLQVWSELAKPRIGPHSLETWWALRPLLWAAVKVELDDTWFCQRRNLTHCVLVVVAARWTWSLPAPQLSPPLLTVVVFIAISRLPSLMTWVVEISPRMPIRGFRYERRDGHLAIPFAVRSGCLRCQARSQRSRHRPWTRPETFVV